MRARKLFTERPALLVSVLIGGGLVIAGAGIHCGLVPAYVMWQVTDFRKLAQWVDFYRLDVQISLLLPSGDVWTGRIRVLLVDLAIAHSMIVVGTILCFIGIRVLRAAEDWPVRRNLEQDSSDAGCMNGGGSKRAIAGSVGSAGWHSLCAPAQPSASGRPIRERLRSLLGD